MESNLTLLEPDYSNNIADVSIPIDFDAENNSSVQLDYNQEVDTSYPDWWMLTMLQDATLSVASTIATNAASFVSNTAAFFTDLDRHFSFPVCEAVSVPPVEYKKLDRHLKEIFSSRDVEDILARILSDKAGENVEPELIKKIKYVVAILDTVANPSKFYSSLIANGLEDIAVERLKKLKSMIGEHNNKTVKFLDLRALESDLRETQALLNVEEAALNRLISTQQEEKNDREKKLNKMREVLKSFIDDLDYNEGLYNSNEEVIKDSLNKIATLENYIRDDLDTKISFFEGQLEELDAIVEEQNGHIDFFNKYQLTEIEANGRIYTLSGALSNLEDANRLIKKDKENIISFSNAKKTCWS